MTNSHTSLSFAEHNTPFYAALVAHVGAHPHGNGEVWTSCPSCGKDQGRKATHFSFSLRGWKCFSCGYSGRNLQKLADQYGTVPVLSPPLPERLPEPRKPRHWQLDPHRFIDGYCAALDRVGRWQAYRPPLTLETIGHRRLGVGVLPASACQHRRLIYPVQMAGQIVALRGRALTCDCPKWLSAGGSQTVLYGLEQVTHGSRVIICESPCDAMLAMQMEPEIVTIAGTAGAGTWKADWTAELVRRQPRDILVWLDNDLAGSPNAATYRALLRAWIQAHPTAPRRPEPAGPRIANDLNRAGLHATLYQWPDATPPKADLGWMLMNGGTA